MSSLRFHCDVQNSIYTYLWNYIMSKTYSARGKLIDFDLLKIRSEIMDTTPSQIVIERQKSIEDQIRLRREQRKQLREKMLQKQAETSVETEVAVKVEPKKVRNRTITDSESET